MYERIGDMFGRSAAEAVRREGATFQQLITNEITLLRAQQEVLLSREKTGLATALILLACFMVNGWAFVSLPDYFALFIAASLYLHMVYFITLMIPIGKGTVSLPVGEIRKFFSVLYRSGIITATDRFTRILLDVFFINSRTLFSGLFPLFSIDILFIAIGYSSGRFSERAVLIILFQIIAFLIFYITVWRLAPGSARFKEEIRGIKGALAVRHYPRWVIGLIFGSGAVLVLLVILSTIILLPGITVKAFVTQSGIEEIGNLFLPIGILAASQYFLLRFLHGIASTQMAAEFSASTLELLQTIGTGDAVSMTEGEAGYAPERTAVSLRTAAAALLEARIYRLDLCTLWGTFPVYLINPDFSIISDEKVISAITGFLKGAGSVSPADE